MLKILQEGRAPKIVTFNQDLLSGELDQRPFSLDVAELEPGKWHVLFNNKSYNAELIEMDKTTRQITIRINGSEYQMQVRDRFDDLLEKLGMDRAAASAERDVKAPMPGLVLEVLVEEGQTVEKDTPLLILEAMKMENVIKSPSDARVGKIRISTGKAVEKNEVLIEFAD